MLNEEGIKHFQHIIGVSQWLVTAGRFDISYAVTSLSRFSASPREKHLEYAVKIFKYLKKFSIKGYTIDSIPHQNIKDSQIQHVEDFGSQYSMWMVQQGRANMAPKQHKTVRKHSRFFCSTPHAPHVTPKARRDLT